MLTTSHSSAGNALLASYAATTLGQSGPHDASRLHLTVDERYRLQLRSLADGRIQVRSRLCELPEAGPARDELLRSMGALACGRIQSAGAACVVDADERAFWLSQTVAASSAQEVDELVGDFVNELAFWGQVLSRQ
ncbi:hypothetical protein [Comamonas sp. NLF-1-9]|uniref:hypothetical protein n=1 Tax=Comamonas sp. NLF-1-9 TaxID=2853163 RepID=UPI001C478B52|nr:hypothetical protein [Comamonas sp. NLF-1-9]QXL83634.1 hypothetical protein KUD94_10285 [Comamonas sp. NLF-1-9]